MEGMENVPPSPSPPPRLRRSPKRRALHERADSNDAVAARPPSPLGRPIRRVIEDESDHHQQQQWEQQQQQQRDVDNAKFYAASPFPSAAVQRLPPPPRLVVADDVVVEAEEEEEGEQDGAFAAQGGSRGRTPTHTRNIPVLPRASVPVSRCSNTQGASPHLPAHRPVNAPRRRADQYDGPSPRTPALPTARRILELDAPSSSSAGSTAATTSNTASSSSYSAAAPTSSASFSSSPPWIVITPPHHDFSSPPRSLDVDRRAMDFPRDEDGGAASRPPDPPTVLYSSPPASAAAAAAASAADGHDGAVGASSAAAAAAATSAAFARSYETPVAAYRPSLGGTAGVNSTPLTTSSAGSAGTVHHQQHLAGQLPPTHFSLFPPATPSAHHRPRTPPSSSSRRSRARSDPPPLLSTMDISPASSGASGSPVSPLSPGEEELADRARNIYIQPSRTVSDPALDTLTGDLRIPIDMQRAGRDDTPNPNPPRTLPVSLFDRIASQASQAGLAIPRPRPATMQRNDSARIVSVMSTIASEGTAERDEHSSSRAPSHRAHESRSSSGEVNLGGASGEQEEGDMSAFERRSGWTPDRTPPRISRRASASAVEKDLPPLPEMLTPEPGSERSPEAARHSSPPLVIRPPEPEGSMSPLDAPHSAPPPVEYFSPTTTLRSNRNSGGSFRRFRESLPAWARLYYRNPQQYRATILGTPTLGTIHDSPATSLRRRTIGSVRSGRDARPESLRLTRAEEQALLAEYEARQRFERAQRTLRSRYAPFRGDAAASDTEPIGPATRPDRRSVPIPERPSLERGSARHSRSRSAPSTPRSASPSPMSQVPRDTSRAGILEPGLFARNGVLPQRPLSESSLYSRSQSADNDDDDESPVLPVRPFSDISTGSSGPLRVPRRPVPYRAASDEPITPRRRSARLDATGAASDERISRQPVSARPPPEILIAGDMPTDDAADAEGTADADGGNDTGARRARALNDEAWYDSHGETSPELDPAVAATRPLPLASPLASHPLPPTPRSADAGRSVPKDQERLHPVYPSVPYRGERDSRRGSHRDSHRNSHRDSHRDSRRSERRSARPVSDDPTAAYSGNRDSYRDSHRRSERRSARPISDTAPAQPERAHRRSTRRHSEPSDEITPAGAADDDNAGPSEYYLHPDAIYRRSGRFSQRPTSSIPPLPRTDLAVSARYPSNMDYDWSPHLWYDRRSTMLRRRTYIEPSINESLEGWTPSRRNAQVWLFALGFIMPLAWIVAAFLPLPAEPGSPPPSPGAARDLEKQLLPEDVRRFENARWWRNVNRWMVPVAVAILVAVIVLVVVAARTGM